MPDTTPLVNSESGDDLEGCLKIDLEAFTELMRVGIRSHPQFQKEYPRKWNFSYQLVGEDSDIDWVLTLEADDEKVRVHKIGNEVFLDKRNK